MVDALVPMEFGCVLRILAVEFFLRRCVWTGFCFAVTVWAWGFVNAFEFYFVYLRRRDFLSKIFVKAV